ncbi:MAG: MAPEG family protein [Roseiarcus sp.]
MTVAFWCVLVAALLPYIPFGLASKKLNPHAPRIGAQALEGLAARGYGAHLNGFEAFPFFAAAVIVSHLAEGANATVGWLAVAFVVARLAHMAAYLMDRPPVRTTFFFVGLALTIVIFVHPAFH